LKIPPAKKPGTALYCLICSPTLLTLKLAVTMPQVHIISHRNYQSIKQGESLARGPKLLSMYTVEERGLLVRKYWQTGSFKARQKTFRTEFGERRAPSKCCIQKSVKNLETRGSRSNACRLLSLGAYLRAKCTKIHPAQSNNSKTLYTKRFKAVNIDTLGKVFQNLGKSIQVCLDVKGDQFQHRL